MNEERGFVVVDAFESEIMIWIESQKRHNCHHCSVYLIARKMIVQDGWLVSDSGFAVEREREVELSV